jgi:probable HAF family extracellular repeat protein
MKLRQLPAIISTSLIMGALVSCPGLASIRVQSLPLPPGATIAREGDRVQIVSRGNIIAATVDMDQIHRVAIWQRGHVHVLPIVKKFTLGGPNFRVLGAVTTDGKTYVNAGYSFNGAYSGIKYYIFLFNGKSYSEVSLPHCDLRGEPGEPIVEDVSDDSLAVTFQSPSFIDLTNVDTGRYAPNAAIVTGGTCVVVGRATIVAIHGRYAVGFQGYLGSTVAPTNVQVDQQASVAVRWVDHEMQRLGNGVAFGVNSLGQAVGATMSPDYVGGSVYLGNGMVGGKPGLPQPAQPHAILWGTDGTSILLIPKFRSIAYAIADDGRVIGTFQDSTGRHFAFVWKAGLLRRLDDIALDRRWHFESAYAFTSDGGIVGIGRHDGVASLFVLHL